MKSPTVGQFILFPREFILKLKNKSLNEFRIALVLKHLSSIKTPISGCSYAYEISRSEIKQHPILKSNKRAIYELENILNGFENDDSDDYLFKTFCKVDVNGSVQIMFNPKFIRGGKNRCRLEVPDICKMKSVIDLKMYCLMCGATGLNVYNKKPVDLMEYFGVDIDVKYFMRDYIIRSVNNINRLTNLMVIVGKRKVGRDITSINFKVMTKEGDI